MMATAPVRLEVVRAMVTHGSGERHALRVGATSASALRCTPRPDLTYREYNEERPKESLGGLTTALYA